jgi:hypothetical protein
MKENKPNEAGIYLAKSPNYKWWNWIVEVGGEAPWLKIEWVVSRIDGGPCADKSLIDKLEFGPKLHEDNLND